jgi:integrase
MSKKNIVFTDIMIKKLKPAESKYIRSEGNGFTVRVMPSGVKTWLYVYSFDSKRREMNMGNYPYVSLETARGKFDDARKKVKNGIDPMAEAEAEAEAREKAPTVTDLVDDYIKLHAKRFKRSWKKDEQILSRDVVPLWGKKKAVDITKRNVLHLLERIIDRGAPAMANNCFQIVRKMFNFAVERDILPLSPCTGVKLPSPKQTRERTLNEVEIKAMWGNLDKCAMSDEIRRALKLILVTAQRPGEVIGMHTSEIDDRWWTIPPERAKNGKTHRVYLTDTALELVGDLEVIDEETGKTKPKGYIFPTPHKKKERAIAPQALIVAVIRALASPALDEKGNPVKEEEGKPTENMLHIDHFTPHDLRRTAATFMAQSGEMDEVIDAILNHAKQGVIKVYNQYRYDKEKQAALEAWERKLTSIVTGSKSNVVSMRRKAS